LTRAAPRVTTARQIFSANRLAAETNTKMTDTNAFNVKIGNARAAVFGIFAELFIFSLNFLFKLA